MKAHKTQKEEFEKELHETVEYVSRAYARVTPLPKLLESILKDLPQGAASSVSEVRAAPVPSPFAFMLNWKVLAPAFVVVIVVATMVNPQGDVIVPRSDDTTLAMDSQMMLSPESASFAMESNQPEPTGRMMAKGASNEGVSMMSLSAPVVSPIPITGGVDDILAQIEADVSGDQNLFVDPQGEAALVTYDNSAASGFGETYDETTI